jgi:hypothetical protein
MEGGDLFMKRYLLLGLLISLGGCSSPALIENDSETRVLEIEQFSSRPRQTRAALSLAEVQAIATETNSEAAIKKLDKQPFNFKLDDGHLAKLKASGVKGDVFDYLEKRSAINWDHLHSDQLILEKLNPEELLFIRYAEEKQPWQLPIRASFYADYGYTPLTRSVYRVGRRHGRRQYYAGPRRGRSYRSSAGFSFNFGRQR